MSNVKELEDGLGFVRELTRKSERRPSPTSIYLMWALISLVGFSQGAYLGSYIALSRPDVFSHLVCCCGRPKAEFVEDLSAARDLAVLVQTGRDDESVAPELIAKGVAPLREAGLSVTEKSYDSAHRMTAEMAGDAAGFVA